MNTSRCKLKGSGLSRLVRACTLAISAFVMAVWATPAYALGARQFAASDDTDFTLVYILGGVGVGVLIVAIVLKVMGSRAGKGGRGSGGPGGRHTR